MKHVVDMKVNMNYTFNEINKFMKAVILGSRLGYGHITKGLYIWKFDGDKETSFANYFISLTSLQHYSSCHMPLARPIYRMTD